MCGHPYSSTLQINNLEDAVYSVAPGEGSTPLYILMDHSLEVLALPDLFPTGRDGSDTVHFRETNLSTPILSTKIIECGWKICKRY